MTQAIRQFAGTVLALVLVVAPAASVDVYLTQPALSARCAEVCEAHGTAIVRFARSWVRGTPSTCHCATGAERPSDATTWWALVEVLVFLSSIPIATLARHRIATRDP